MQHAGALFIFVGIVVVDMRIQEKKEKAIEYEKGES